MTSKCGSFLGLGVLAALGIWSSTLLAEDPAPRTGAAPNTRGAMGALSLHFVDTNSVPVPKVMCRLRRPQSGADSARPALLRNGALRQVQSGAWVIEICPSVERPYLGDAEIDIEPGKLLTALVQVREVRVGRLRMDVTSEDGVPLKQIYASSRPSRMPTLSADAVTSASGKASLPVPIGEPTLVRFFGLPNAPYAAQEREITQQEAEKDLAVVLKRKKVSAACGAHFEEDGVRSEMALTNGIPHVIFHAKGQAREPMKAYVSEGRFVFHDLPPGEYEIKELVHVFNVRATGGMRRYYAALSPVRNVTFRTTGSGKTIDLGSVAFERWPARPSKIRGAVAGVGEKREGIKIVAVRINARNERSDVTFEAVTDVRGRFTLRDLPSGLYDLDATIGGRRVGRVKRVEAWPIGTPLVTVYCTLPRSVR